MGLSRLRVDFGNDVMVVSLHHVLEFSHSNGIFDCIISVVCYPLFFDYIVSFIVPIFYANVVKFCF